VISASQGLPDNTQHSQQTLPCPRWDSNQQSHQTAGQNPPRVVAPIKEEKEEEEEEEEEEAESQQAKGRKPTP
jgi:hypothetical protein